VPAAPAPAGSSTTRVFGLQPKGAKDSAAIVVAHDKVVGLLKEEIKKKLELDARLQDITLQLASADGALFTAKDAAGNEQPVTLSSMDTIDEALQKAAEAAGRTIGDNDKLRIIVGVVAPAAPPPPPLAASADGEDADAVQRTRMRSCAVLLCHCTARFCSPLSSDSHTACCCHCLRRHHCTCTLQHCVRKPSFSPRCGRPCSSQRRWRTLPR
jgi:hypothetical protein